MRRDPKNTPIPEWGTPELLAEICGRSAEGEGVEAILAEKGLPNLSTMEWLRDHHHAEIVAAKQEQLKKRKEK